MDSSVTLRLAPMQDGDHSETSGARVAWRLPALLFCLGLCFMYIFSKPSKFGFVE